MIIVLNELYVLNLTINKYKYITKSLYMYMSKKLKIQNSVLSSVIMAYKLNNEANVKKIKHNVQWN